MGNLTLFCPHSKCPRSQVPFDSRVRYRRHMREVHDEYVVVRNRPAQKSESTGALKYAERRMKLLDVKTGSDVAKLVLRRLISMHDYAQAQHAPDLGDLAKQVQSFVARNEKGDLAVRSLLREARPELLRLAYDSLPHIPAFDPVSFLQLTQTRQSQLFELRARLLQDRMSFNCVDLDVDAPEQPKHTLSRRLRVQSGSTVSDNG